PRLRYISAPNRTTGTMVTSRIVLIASGEVEGLPVTERVLDAVRVRPIESVTLSLTLYCPGDVYVCVVGATIPGASRELLFTKASPNPHWRRYGEVPPQTVGVNDTGTPAVAVVAVKLARRGRGVSLGVSRYGVVRATLWAWAGIGGGE